MATTQFNREAEVNALKRAIAVERRAHCADFQGRRTTFSSFMRQTADKLCRLYPIDPRWATIRAYFRQYANLDLATRISVLHRVEELLAQTDSPATARPAAKSSPEPKPAAKPVPYRTFTPGPAKDSRPQSGPATWASPDQVEVQFVKGVGPKMAALLQQLNIHTVADLLRHYPRRHLDFHNRLLIRDLKPGQEVTVFGVIRSVSAFQSRKGNLSVVSVVINDGTGSAVVTRFIGGKSNKYLLDRYKDQFPKGAQVMASGTVELDRIRHRYQLRNAQVEVLESAEDLESSSIPSLHAGRLVPVYSLTEGIGLRYLRTIIHNALETYGHHLPEPLPEPIRQQHQLIDRKAALWGIHFPEDAISLEAARRRLVFDELFGIQLQLAYRRHRFDNNELGLALSLSANSLVERLKESLPFKLTSAQERVFAEIARDLSSPKPLHRLVQGDVGSGKTVVALMSFLVAIENGYQGTMMAPTEILAEQHYRQFVKLLTPLGLRCALFLGKQGQKERRQLQQDLLSGQVHLAVGTHALIQDGVEFKNLGLIIIDEQHRFGVKQRARLKSKGQNPELLTMTATPIPRTLALTLHGDLDISEIDELPAGRKPIQTRLLGPGEKRQLWGFLREEIAKGRQAYIVFPLIEESETLSAKAAKAEYEKLRQGVFQDLRLGLMHGKLKPQEKEEVMEQFRTGQIDILVSTTVVEVGVDVPNATVMVIENADRFGLAQLHQLRGRVGRGNEQSYCLLVGDTRSESTRQRLEIMTQTNDGFVIAQKDLELRGPGEFLGVRQSGLPDLLLADLVHDTKILEEARQAAIQLIKEDPQLEHYPSLKAAVQLGLAAQEADLIKSG